MIFPLDDINVKGFFLVSRQTCINCSRQIQYLIHTPAKVYMDNILVQFFGLVGLWCLTPLSTIFQLYRVCGFDT
jgi:hypothetical protein